MRRGTESFMEAARVSPRHLPKPIYTFPYYSLLKPCSVNLPQLSFRADLNNTGSLADPHDTPQYPLTSDIDAWASLGANLYRLPVLWNWLQTDGNFDSNLSPDVMSQLDALISYATRNSSSSPQTLENATYVILDIVMRQESTKSKDHF